jgi:hypothetical protein
MSLLARLLTAALLLPQPYYPPGHEPETPQERASRIEVIVSAAVDASEATEDWPGTKEELAAALLSVTWYESRRCALEVHDGRARGDHGASKCLAQIWTEDRSIVGTSKEATLRCFERATEILVLHAKRCGIRRIDELQMARLFGAYGTGRTCHSLPWARMRARHWTNLLRAASAADTELSVSRDEPQAPVALTDQRARVAGPRAAAVAASPQ